MNRIPNRKFDSKSNRISNLRRSLMYALERFIFNIFCANRRISYNNPASLVELFYFSFIAVVRAADGCTHPHYVIARVKSRSVA